MLDSQIGAGRNEIHMVGLNLGTVSRLQHDHRRVTCQKIGHEAIVVGIKMLDQDDRHSAVCWESVEEFPEGVEATRRCAKPHNRKICRLALWLRAFARLRLYLARLWRTPFYHDLSFHNAGFPEGQRANAKLVLS